jgi:hypothetical protein
VSEAKPSDFDHAKATAKLLKSRAKALLKVIERVEDGMCADLARAALLEAAAILADCSEQCEMMPNRIDESDNG